MGDSIHRCVSLACCRIGRSQRILDLIGRRGAPEEYPARSVGNRNIGDPARIGGLLRLLGRDGIGRWGNGVGRERILERLLKGEVIECRLFD